MKKNIIISNPIRLEKIKKEMIKDGVGKIYVLADFDRTLTKNGKSRPSIISILRDKNYLRSDYSQKAKALFNKYHPMEVDPYILMKQKKKAMEEWWRSHFNLLVKSGLNKKDLKSIIELGIIEFREGVLEFLDFLKEYKIPLVIMSSGGLGKDPIKIFLNKKKRLYNNIHIISNSYNWDKAGNAISVEEPIIHCMNKDETMIQKFPVFKVIKERKNVLLLGDNLGDIGMIDGFDYDNLIKIGFLNSEIEKNLEEYQRSYDVLILNDGSMDYVNNFLKKIV
ncbi:MAG: hypothetical protein GWO87_01660 [Xanthomonadaceae bacterium]|nr:hypothetical protein [Rhodospirillaceae bacterium]NIA17877.1 hypothetical protein [Xanthomonadaceae bacterium]